MLPIVVRAIQSVVLEMEPGWVASVSDAIPQADDERVLAAWCGVPLEAVCAVVDLLDEEGSARWSGYWGSGEG